MKFIDPKNDVVFKKIFGQHPEILKSFLNSMLPLQEGHEIVELSYLSPEMLPETFLEKFTSVDVRCIDNTGRQFLVEMHMNWTTAFKQRVLFNTSKAYVTQTTKGFEYRNLKPVYALNLINQNLSAKQPGLLPPLFGSALPKTATKSWNAWSLSLSSLKNSGQRIWQTKSCRFCGCGF